MTIELAHIQYSLTDWLAYVESLHKKSIDLGLERTLVIAQSLQLTQFACPVITIAGTNGKGSCVRSLESIYLAAGYRVVSYTSPHLQSFNERIRILGKEVADSFLITAFAKIEEIRQHHSLTFFEFTTLAALWIFKQSQPEIVLLEVGLGGRLDAVNVVESDVAVITSIDLDHMDWLGSDRESIAREKAGIFRAGKQAVCGDEHPPDNIALLAKQANASLYQIGIDFHVIATSEDDWSWQTNTRIYPALPKTALKPQNVAASLMAIELLQNRLPVAEQTIKDILPQLYLEGRFEYFSTPVPCIVDVAHNPAATNWLAKQLKNLNGHCYRIAIVGMLKDKAIRDSIEPLMPQVDYWYTASLNVERGASNQLVTTELLACGVKHYRSFINIEMAILAAIEHAKTLPNAELLIFGSFYTVSAALKFFKK